MQLSPLSLLVLCCNLGLSVASCQSGPPARQVPPAAPRPTVSQPADGGAEAELSGGASQDDASVSPSVLPLSQQELAFLDQLVTDEVLFPDASERKRYTQLAPETTHNQRHYSFELKPERGMKKGRHYHIIDVAIARAGTYTSTQHAPTVTGTSGPNGGFTEFATRTRDGAYDVRISQSMLLVEPVKVPTFAPHQAALDLLRKYDAFRADSAVIGGT